MAGKEAVIMKGVDIGRSRHIMVMLLAVASSHGWARVTIATMMTISEITSTIDTQAGVDLTGVAMSTAVAVRGRLVLVVTIMSMARVSTAVAVPMITPDITTISHGVMSHPCDRMEATDPTIDRLVLIDGLMKTMRELPTPIVYETVLAVP